MPRAAVAIPCDLCCRSLFQVDPKCRVLLLMMSTSGGAAGLTLTVASTLILMEPTVNPGLEAQARVHARHVLVDAWFRYPAAVRYYLTSCSVPVCCLHMFAL